MQHTFCILFILIASWTNISHGQSSLIINEDRPSLIDTVLQVVWEPSSLIRFWTALDQLYNIGLSWRTVAKTIVTLPFRDGRSMSHIRIQEPRRARGMIKSQTRHLNLNHLDRFNKIYAEGSSPSFHLAAPSNVYESHVMPPPFVFSPQGAIPDPKLAELSQLLAHNDLRVLPGFYGNKIQYQNVVPKYPEWLVQGIERGNDVVVQKPPHFAPVESMNVQVPFPFGGASIPSGNPEARLNMFLKLMKDLGEIHTNKVIFDEDAKEGIR